jgi:pimeloyl-ACP methyl ester carboxylesterase
MPPETIAQTNANDAPSRPPCPAPANFQAEVLAYDQNAEAAIWDGPRYRLTYRVLGQGPPLIVCPGIASTYRGYAVMLNRLAARFRTVVYDYPGEQPGDGARLGRITHDDLVADVFGLIEHLHFGRVFLFGPSFGSTVVLRLLHREPRRFPRAVLQGAFARRHFTMAERCALFFGRLIPGHVGRLPLQEPLLAWNNKCHFPDPVLDRWPYFVEQNGLTPIAPLARRLDMLARLDLRPILKEVPTEILILHGNEDRLIPRRYYDELCAVLPNAQGVLMPLVGHQPHFTHPEALAQAIGDFLLPCAPGGCPNDEQREEN